MLNETTKIYITRYIRLNQPCSLSNLVNDICYNKNGPEANIQELFTYLYNLTLDKHIIIQPNIFDKDFKDFKGFTITNLQKRHIDAKVYIPQYVVWIWKNWFNKKILGDK